MLISLNELQNVEEIVSLSSTLEVARLKPEFFTRERKMTFPDIVVFILSGFKNATQTALNRFFGDVLEKKDSMSQQAFSKARSHFDHSPFELLFRDMVRRRFSGEHEIRLMHSFQIFAVDGSDMALPDIPKLLADFGGTGRYADSPTAKISLLYDVLNDFIVDAAITKAGSSERELAVQHMEKLQDIGNKEKKLLIFDRGYPSAALINELVKRELYYLMRVKSRWNKEVDAIDSHDSLLKLNGETAVRVVKIQLPTGETETLLTNLFELPVEEFAKLYFKRWPIETKYDVLKNKLELENFTGYSKNVILQDFWSTMYLSNLVTVVKEEAEAEACKEEKSKNTRYEYTPNLNQVIATLKDHLLRVFFTESIEERKCCLNFMMTTIKSAMRPIRPNRVVKRPLNPRKVKFHHNRKSPT